MFVLVLLCNKNYTKEKAMENINKKFPGPRNTLVLGDFPVTQKDINIHIDFDLCIRNMARFTETFRSFFDLVVYVTDSSSVVGGLDMFACQYLLKNGGKMVFLQKDKFSNDSSLLTNNAREQVNASFKSSDGFLAKEATPKSYTPLVKIICKKTDFSCFSVLYNFLPETLKNFCVSMSKKKTVKNKTFARFISKFNDMNKEDIYFEKVDNYTLQTSPELTKKVNSIHKECFGIPLMNLSSKKSFWYFLMFKNEIRSMLLVEMAEKGVVIIWNVCTPKKYRKKGYSHKLLNYVFPKYKKDLYLTVKIQEGYEKLVRFYNGMGFVNYKVVDDMYYMCRRYFSTGLNFCQSSTQSIYLDLDRVKLGETIEVPKSIEYEKGEPLPLLLYGTQALVPVEILGSGSYGTVYKYSNKSKLEYKTKKEKFQLKHHDNPEIFLCVKFFKRKYRDREFGDESDMIRKIGKIEGKNCGIVNARAIDENGQKIVIMDCLDGTVGEKLYTIKDANKILGELAKILDCLYKNGFLYTDLGKQNVAYKCIGKGYKLLLIDLGGLCKIGERKVFKKRGGVLRDPNIKIEDFYCSQNFIVWKLAVFYMSILQKSKGNWWYKKIAGKKGVDHDDKIYYKNIYKKLKHIKDAETKDLLYKMFAGYDVSDKNVITLEQIHKKLLE
jgi:hypothetical protein